MYSYTELLTITNARLLWDASLCRLGAVGGDGNGSYSYARTTIENRFALDGSDPNCLHICKAQPFFCAGVEMVGSGDLSPDCLMIRCGDPCAEFFGTPVVDEHLLMEFSILATVTVTESVSTPCIPIHGTPPAPYVVNLNLDGTFIADIECLDATSFGVRGLKWPSFEPVWDASDVCSGYYDVRGWACEGGFGTPIHVVPIYEQNSSATSCDVFDCLDDHHCIAATPPYGITFSCGCNGDEATPDSGQGYKHSEWDRTHTMVVTIP